MFCMSCTHFFDALDDLRFMRLRLTLPQRFGLAWRQAGCVGRVGIVAWHVQSYTY